MADDRKTTKCSNRIRSTSTNHQLGTSSGSKVGTSVGSKSLVVGTTSALGDPPYLPPAYVPTGPARPSLNTAANQASERPPVGETMLFLLSCKPPMGRLFGAFKRLGIVDEILAGMRCWDSKQVAEFFEMVAQENVDGDRDRFTKIVVHILVTHLRTYARELIT